MRHERWFEVVITVLTAEGLEPARTGRIDPRLLVAVRQLDRQPLVKPIVDTALARSVGVSVSHPARGCGASVWRFENEKASP